MSLKLSLFFSFVYFTIYSLEKTLDGDQEKCEEDEEEEEEESIDVGLMDNVKTAGGALLLLVLFLRIQSIIIILSSIPRSLSSVFHNWQNNYTLICNTINHVLDALELLRLDF